VAHIVEDLSGHQLKCCAKTAVAGSTFLNR
jgi:hypothetical protein